MVCPSSGDGVPDIQSAYQKVFEGVVVCDDAIVDHHKLVGWVRDVGVGVSRGWGTVGCPAGVGDADLGIDDGVEVDALFLEGGVGELHEVIDLPRRLDNRAGIAVRVHAVGGAIGSARGGGVEVKGDTSRVVSAVFQSLESGK